MCFFDSVDQDQLMEFLARCISDKRLLSYIKRFLKAGIQEDGVFKDSDRGTPQCGVSLTIVGEFVPSFHP